MGEGGALNAVLASESLPASAAPTFAPVAEPRPQVSVLLLCFRDADYIRAAIESAFAQTVPCQIIVSNDCSDDATFDIAVEMVAAYRGPHRVSVRRTERNLGVSAHFNDAMTLAHGDIIVMMAGDDIAYPERVATIVRAFDQAPDAMVLGSDFDGIGTRGEPIKVSFRARPERYELDYYVRIGRLIGLLGATMAFRRCVYDRFGPLLGPIEDNALSLRGALLGQSLCLRQPLIQYRRHPGSVSGTVFARDEPRAVATRRRYERTVQFYRGTADDLESCLRQMPELPERKRRLARQVLAMYRIEADAREAIIAQPRWRWLGPVMRGLAQRGLRRKSAERALKLLLPRSWFGLR
ncbi:MULTISPECIES: glycosyltransferase [Lysobacter]|jgi:glycosyltransferase involved in cell wall biosynthesis|uniref:glycosyltransferase n=1 Tax=Lysobacter TaxID=68 RepID=UPI001F39E4EB|nr:MULTISPECIES: glycosyltransferase [Lysobacter]UJB18513.1 glycosyltransferase [Lysobacter capsici]UJQ27762.1 glycosyltransferase [Lysobacter gummosus]